VTTFGLLSTYPPTQCGLATFTASLVAHLGPPAACGVVRLVDEADVGSPPEVVHELLRGSTTSQCDAVAALNGFDAVIVQHEYGIFGGPDGDEVLTVLDVITAPTIVVLHTVLVDPTRHQRQVLEGVVHSADAVVTMTRTASRRLRDGYDVDMAKVSVIPHGAHLPPLTLEASAPAARPTILTWGLIGPGKGIEWGIEALALLGDLEPAPRYLVVGETHPRVLEQHGETYRNGLQARARQLGVAHLVDFDATYLDVASLHRIIRDADVVLLPYDNPDQVTSGVLIEAVAAAKPVISARFPHAVELLGGGVGLLVGHRDPVAISRAVRRVLTEPGLKGDMTAGAARLAPQLGWSFVAGQYRALAAHLISSRTGAMA